MAGSLLEVEAFLPEVPIKGERLPLPFRSHHHEGHAIDETQLDSR